MLKGNVFAPRITPLLSTVTKGFCISIKAAIVPFKTPSIILPQSLTTIQLTVICHTYLPVKIHKDSGSSEFDYIITF